MHSFLCRQTGTLHNRELRSVFMTICGCRPASVNTDNPFNKSRSRSAFRDTRPLTLFRSNCTRFSLNSIGDTKDYVQF